MKKIFLRAIVLLLVLSLAFSAFASCGETEKQDNGTHSVTSICYNAFHTCTRLTSVTIGNSVESIGDSAFYYCVGLTSIKYRGSEAEWNAIKKGEDWNYNVPSSCQIIFDYTGE